MYSTGGLEEAGDSEISGQLLSGSSGSRRKDRSAIQPECSRYRADVFSIGQVECSPASRIKASESWVNCVNRSRLMDVRGGGGDHIISCSNTGNQGPISATIKAPGP